MNPAFDRSPAVWWPWLPMLALAALGLTLVSSATMESSGFGRQAWMQGTWWLVAVVVALAASAIPWAAWRAAAIPLYIAALVVQLLMMALAGTTLAPVIKGQANWLVLGPISIQPVELVKVATLLMGAVLITGIGFAAGKIAHVLLALAIAGVPAVINMKNDLGSSLCFPGMVLAQLVAAGMRLRHLALLGLGAALLIGIGVALLPKDGAKSYQYKRIQAWLHPEQYALTEGYQTDRAITAIGSGQWLGKGWAEGDLNRLGWLPEKHTDLIAAVLGEEFGLLGCLVLVALFTALAWTMLGAAAQARNDTARIYLAGWVGLTLGQASINLAVVTGLMPVTGVPLPLLSYGGSSLVAVHLGFGIGLSALRAPRTS
jgi:rod shape determining protein RodA